MKQTSMDFLRAKLPHDKAELERIATGAKVPFHTLRKIQSGETQNPRIATVENLMRFYGRRFN